MKALPPAPPQLQLTICHDVALTVTDQTAQKEAVRALAEILLAAADAVEVQGQPAEEDHETP